MFRKTVGNMAREEKSGQCESGFQSARSIKRVIHGLMEVTECRPLVERTES